MHLQDLIRLSRPHFLLGGALMYAVGAVSAGVTDPIVYLIGQLAVTASQLTAHYVNEYADVEADALVANRTWFSGGSGVLVDGSVDRRVAIRAASITSVVSLAASAALAATSVTAAAVVTATLAVSWGYSMPPIRLLSTGWGEFATSLTVTVAVPLVGAMAQGGSFDTGLLWAMAALFCIHMSMILAFELPDLDTDAAAGKQVLAVRLEPARTRRLIRALIVLSLVVVTLGAAVDEPGLLWILLAAPPMTVLASTIQTERFRVVTSAAVASVGFGAVGALLTMIG
jgi:1,4-dihydroxy-2-naphthoate octaprenyltransferase